MAGLTSIVMGGRNGLAESQNNAAPIVATAASDNATAALARKRSNSSIASKPTIGIAISVAQKVKRSKVKMSKARPSSHFGSGVVPPNPKRRVSQNPSKSGRNRRSDEPRMTMNGKAKIKAP